MPHRHDIAVDERFVPPGPAWAVYGGGPPLLTSPPGVRRGALVGGTPAVAFFPHRTLSAGRLRRDQRMVLVIGLLVALVGLVGLVRGRIVRLACQEPHGRSARRRRRHGPRPWRRARRRPPHRMPRRRPAAASLRPRPPSASARRPVPSATTLRADPCRLRLGAGGGHTAGAGPRAKAVGHHQAGRGAGDHDARAGTAAAVLAALPVKGRAPRTGYDREQFGQAWARHRPQRLRHPQRHPAPRPDGARAQGRHARLRRPQRHAGRPLHRARRSPSSVAQATSAARADRPRGGALRRVAEGRPAVVTSTRTPASPTTR